MQVRHGKAGRAELLGVTLSDIRPLRIGRLEQEYAMKIRVPSPDGNAAVDPAAVEGGER